MKKYHSFNFLPFNNFWIIPFLTLVFVFSSCGDDHAEQARKAVTMNMIMQKTNYEINKSQQNVEMQKKDTIERNKAAKETLISGEDTVAKVYAQLLLNGTEKGTYTGAGDAENDAATMMVQYGTMTYQSTISGGNLNVTVTEIDTDNKLMSGTFNGKLLALYKDLSADSVVEVDGSFTLPFRDTE